MATIELTCILRSEYSVSTSAATTKTTFLQSSQEVDAGKHHTTRMNCPHCGRGLDVEIFPGLSLRDAVKLEWCDDKGAWHVPLLLVLAFGPQLLLVGGLLVLSIWERAWAPRWAFFAGALLGLALTVWGFLGSAVKHTRPYCRVLNRWKDEHGVLRGEGLRYSPSVGSSVHERGAPSRGETKHYLYHKGRCLSEWLGDSEVSKLEGRRRFYGEKQ